MPLFEHTFLKPGTYRVGDRFEQLRPNDIGAFAKGTKGMIAAGYLPPLVLEHPEPGSKEGSPRDAKAKRLKHQVGWVKDVTQNEDGSAKAVYEVTDKTAAKQFQEGTIQFTSPEFRPAFVDGKGTKHENIWAHFAVTAKPRAIDQEKPAEVAQFSLNGPVQFGLEDLMDEEDEKPVDEKPEDKKPEEPPANPDAPPAADTGADAQFQAVLAQLKEVTGVDLASDTTPESFVRDLLIALKTVSNSRKQDEAEDAEAEVNEDMPNPLEGANEDKNPMQWSLDDLSEGRIANDLLAKVIRQDRDSMSARLAGMVEANKITPAIREALMNRPVQFSADSGDNLPTYTLPEVVELLDGMPEGQRWTGSLIAQFSVEAPHPSGDGYFTGPGEDMSIEDARKHVAEFAKKNPGLFK